MTGVGRLLYLMPKGRRSICVEIHLCNGITGLEARGDGDLEAILREVVLGADERDGEKDAHLLVWTGAC